MKKDIIYAIVYIIAGAFLFFCSFIKPGVTFNEMLICGMLSVGCAISAGYFFRRAYIMSKINVTEDMVAAKEENKTA